MINTEILQEELQVHKFDTKELEKWEFSPDPWLQHRFEMAKQLGVFHNRLITNGDQHYILSDFAIGSDSICHELTLELQIIQNGYWYSHARVLIDTEDLSFTWCNYKNFDMDDKREQFHWIRNDIKEKLTNIKENITNGKEE